MTRTMSHPRTLSQSLGLVVRNLVFTVVVPGLGGAWLPWWLLTHGHTNPTPAAWEAIPVIAAGAALYFWCAWNFATVGGGTPGPWDAPRRVVARGPYRWVRNPIYLAALLVVLGEAWLFTSPRLLAYAGVMAACFHLFVTGYEERTLARRFGPAYLEYRRAVPRWIPRKPQSPQPRAPNPRGEVTMTTIRRASLAVLAILVLEYGIGMYVSLYATVPSTDRGASIAAAIAHGRFHGLAVMTGIALLCYAANLYLLPRPASQAHTAGQAYPAGGAAGGATTGAGKSRV